MKDLILPLAGAIVAIGLMIGGLLIHKMLIQEVIRETVKSEYLK